MMENHTPEASLGKINLRVWGPRVNHPDFMSWQKLLWDSAEGGSLISECCNSCTSTVAMGGKGEDGATERMDGNLAEVEVQRILVESAEQEQNGNTEEQERQKKELNDLKEAMEVSRKEEDERLRMEEEERARIRNEPVYFYKSTSVLLRRLGEDCEGKWDWETALSQKKSLKECLADVLDIEYRCLFHWFKGIQAYVAKYFQSVADEIWRCSCPVTGTNGFADVYERVLQRVKGELEQDVQGIAAKEVPDIFAEWRWTGDGSQEAPITLD